jgi:predicted transcriptional regulator
MGDVQYHVHRLDKQRRILSIRRGLYRFFYASDLFGQRQRDVLSFLTLETPRVLLLAIIERPGRGQEDLAREASVSQPTVSWHLKRLVEFGIVERHQSGRTVTYSVKGDDAADIARFVRNYHPSVWERWSSRLADIFISYPGQEDRADK